MADLGLERQNGLEAAVLKAAASGKLIFGICGGYQMLGESLSDPEGVEGGGTMKGMGLLPMDTVFAGDKTRTRVSGTFTQVEGRLKELSGVELEGYEIHMGVTTVKEGARSLTETRIMVLRQKGRQRKMGPIRIMYMVPMCMGCLKKKKFQRL